MFVLIYSYSYLLNFDLLGSFRPLVLGLGQRNLDPVNYHFSSSVGIFFLKTHYLLSEGLG